MDMVACFGAPPTPQPINAMKKAVFKHQETGQIIKTHPTDAWRWQEVNGWVRIFPETKTEKPKAKKGNTK